MKKMFEIRKAATYGCLLALGLPGMLMMAGCLKYDRLISPADNTIFMPQAADERSVLTLYKIDSVQTVYFGATIGGFITHNENIHVTFAVDTALVASFNQQYGYLGKTYKVLPEEAYVIEELSSTIPAGSSSATALPIEINVSRLNSHLDYMLPIRIASTSEGIIDSAMGVTYFRIDSLQVRSRDVTSQGKLSVSNENTNGPTGKQGSSFVVDGNISTKFFCPGFNDDFWIQLEFEQPIVVDAYTLASANDRPDRDPRTWQLQGSADGKSWVTIDLRTDYSFTNRLTEAYFELGEQQDGDDSMDRQRSFKYYRLHITENNGAGAQFQLAELRLLQYY